MIRKYQTLWSGILMLLILVFSWIISINQINDFKVNNDEVNDLENEQVINTLDIHTLVLGNNISINEYIKKDNLYYALGSNGKYPYMQIVESKDQYFNPKQAITYKTTEGSLVSIEDEKYYLKTTILSNNKYINQDFFVTKNEIIPFYKKQLTMNYSVGTTITPKYIVIHETDNTNVGADAAGHFNYWSINATANSSTHFVVDSKQVYQMLELNQMAWHVGDNKGYSDITNSNSIGIEIAVNSDGDYNVAKENAIELAAKLLKTLNMDISQLKTHNDASGKYCPTNILNDSSWTDFVKQVKSKL